MAVQVTWISHASFRIAGAEAVLYIDPWKLPDQPHDADMVFVSHEHFDHCSTADIAKVSKPDTAVIAPASIIEKLHITNAVEPGEQVYIKDIAIETVAAYNIGKPFHPRANNWCGAVFVIDGKRIYYSGDTDLVPEMEGLGDVDLALLPIGGTYTLDPREAAAACERIGCKAAIPYHWGDIIGTPRDAEIFARLAKCKTHVLKPGETLLLE